MNEHQLTKCFRTFWDTHYVDGWARRLKKGELIWAPEISKIPRVKRAYVDKDGLPTVIFEFVLNKEFQNVNKVADIGAIATLIDTYACLGQLADPAYWPRSGSPNREDFALALRDCGLTRSLNLRYLREIPVDRRYFLEVKVISNPADSSFLESRLIDEDDVCYVCGTQDMVKIYKRVVASESNSSSPKQRAKL